MLFRHYASAMLILMLPLRYRRFFIAVIDATLYFR